MKILRVIASMAPSSGGPCQGIRNTIPALSKLGIHNVVVCLDDPKDEFIGKDNFPVYALGPAQNPWAYTPRLVPWLKDNINQYDVVIVHGLWLYHGFAINKVYNQIKGKKPKLFVMPHGMLDPYFQRASNRKLKALRNWFYWKLIESKLIHRADGILFTCEQEMLLASETFRPYHPKKEMNVGYGITEPPPYTSEMSDQFLELCPQAKSNKYFLFLSRIHKKKGVDLLVKAYLNLKKQYYDQELPLLVIAGPGVDTAYGQQLQQLVDQNPLLNESVFFPGMLTGAAKWGAFHGCEIFILPSHQENFGIAVVEALACGRPVLISHQVNIWKEIYLFKGGLISEDNQSGVQKMLNIWMNLSNKQKNIVSKGAKICFQQLFHINEASTKLLQAITEKK